MSRSAFAAGYHPPKVTEKYLDKLTDLVCTRYHRAIKADSRAGTKAMDRYVEARRKLREAWTLYREQAE